MNGAVVFVMGEGSIRLGPLALGNPDPITQFYGCDSEQLAIRLDPPLDIGFQPIGCGNSARFQRAGKRAGQSTGEPGNDMIDGGRQGLGLLYTVILCIAAVHAELQRLLKSFDARFTKGPLLLNDPDSRGVNDFTNDNLLGKQMFWPAKRFNQMREPLFVVLHQ